MLTLRDYAEGSRRFIAVCEGCGREGRVEPGGARGDAGEVGARTGDGAQGHRGPAAVPGVRPAGAAAGTGGSGAQAGVRGRAGVRRRGENASHQPPTADAEMANRTHFARSPASGGCVVHPRSGPRGRRSETGTGGRWRLPFCRDMGAAPARNACGGGKRQRAMVVARGIMAHADPQWVLCGTSHVDADRRRRIGMGSRVRFEDGSFDAVTGRHKDE